jgi:hypothetical protein
MKNLIKNLKLFLLVITAITLTACPSDDDNIIVHPNPQIDLTTDNLIGTYEIIFSEDFFELFETAADGSEITIEKEICLGDTFTNATFIFNPDGTITTSGSFRSVCDLTTNGKTTSSRDIIQLGESFSYIANDSDRTITINDEVFDVTSFTQTTLNMSLNELIVFGSETERYETEIRLVRLTL